MYRPAGHACRHLWLVLLDGVPVGRLGLDVPLEPGSRTALACGPARRRTWTGRDVAMLVILAKLHDGGAHR